MVQLTLSDVCVDFPIHSAQTKGLINTLIGFKGKAHRRIDSEDGGRHFAVHALRNITLDLRRGDRAATEPASPPCCVCCLESTNPPPATSSHKAAYLH